MMPIMLIPMFFPLDLYTGRTGQIYTGRTGQIAHAQHAARRATDLM